MKTFLKVTTVAAALLLAAGCAQESGSPGTPAADPTDCRGCALPGAPPGTGGASGSGSNTDFTSGATASLEDFQTGLGQMFYKSIPNNPTNVRVNININRIGEEVIVRYTDGGRVVEAAFGSQHPYNSSIQNRQYNGWVTHGSTPVWKGFFEDKYGAIVVVVDRTLSLGDGQAAQFIGGSIWFQNFPEVTYPYSPYAPFQGILKTCWEITMGPYDCRTFLDDGKVRLTSSLYPNNKGPNALQNYRKLGEFNGLSRASAGF